MPTPKLAHPVRRKKRWRRGEGNLALLTYLFAFIVTAPIVVWIALFLLFKRMFNNPHKALLWSVDIMTFFFMLSVDAVMHEVWHHHFLGILFFAFLFFSIFFIVLYLLTHQQVVMMRLVKGIWRFNFLLFLSGYLVLVVYGLMASMKF